MYDFFKKNLVNGYIKNMFSWLEWITLTGFVFSVGIKINGFFIFIGIILGIVLYFSALIGIEAFVTPYLINIQLNKWIKWIIAFVITAISVIGVIYILTTAFLSLIQA